MHFHIYIWDFLPQGVMLVLGDLREIHANSVSEGAYKGAYIRLVILSCPHICHCQVSSTKM